jgi:hypothetical protein
MRVEDTGFPSKALTMGTTTIFRVASPRLARNSLMVSAIFSVSGETTMASNSGRSTGVSASSRGTTSKRPGAMDSRSPRTSPTRWA